MTTSTLCLCNETDGNARCSDHGGTTPNAGTLGYHAAKLAAKTDDAYSAHIYRSWFSVARLLLSRKFTEQEAEAIMRSKWTRWAADGYKGGRSSGAPASALADFLDGVIGRNTRNEVEKLVAETFPESPCHCGSRGYTNHTTATGNLCPRNRTSEAR